ncbi:hypothetical protein CLAIMM_10757 isoform 2 [Cladophialophora immunda]|nr:hypothetical protein CLAIMM_10757 isoform 2 [Cladophialophora immunda]
MGDSAPPFEAHIDGGGWAEHPFWVTEKRDREPSSVLESEVAPLKPSAPLNCSRQIIQLGGARPDWIQRSMKPSLNRAVRKAGHQCRCRRSSLTDILRAARATINQAPTAPQRP